MDGGPSGHGLGMTLDRDALSAGWQILGAAGCCRLADCLLGPAPLHPIATRRRPAWKRRCAVDAVWLGELTTVAVALPRRRPPDVLGATADPHCAGYLPVLRGGQL